MDTQIMWDMMVDMGICTNQTLQVATTLEGTSTDTLESVLFILTGYRSLAQMMEE